MSNCNITGSALLLLTLLSCKPSSIHFTETSQLDKAFFLNVPALSGNGNMPVDSVSVYRATLEEQIVDRNEISELKLVNDRSKKSNAIDFPVAGNYQHLYLFILHTRPDKKLCIYLSTSFNANDKCTGLGPAYLGNIRMNLINFQKQLRLKQFGTQFRFDKMRDPTQLHFFLDQRQLQQGILRVYQVIKNVPNNISGMKPVIFNVRNVFNDPDALRFSYEGSYK